MRWVAASSERSCATADEDATSAVVAPLPFGVSDLGDAPADSGSSVAGAGCDRLAVRSARVVSAYY